MGLYKPSRGNHHRDTEGTEGTPVFSVPSVSRYPLPRVDNRRSRSS